MGESLDSSRPPIFLITGAPGAGKTSVSAALMQRFPRGLHIPVDDLRLWVVSGIAHPIPEWTDETTRQFRLARRAAAQMARLYAEAGFAVAVDDVHFPQEADAVFVKAREGHAVHRVLLRPSVEIALSRNALRTNKSFDTSTLSDEIGNLHRNMSVSMYERWGWVVIDTSEMSLEETAEEILVRTGVI
jgi:chloramphenicol 3-O-phosphotransferase